MKTESVEDFLKRGGQIKKPEVKYGYDKHPYKFPFKDYTKTKPITKKQKQILKDKKETRT